MESFDGKTTCPRCGSFSFKPWSELTDDEKLLAERLPGSAEYSKPQRSKHYFCTRCWYEEPRPMSTIA